MQQKLNSLEINIEEVPIFTWKGQRRIIKLSDFAYGEWLVYKFNAPVFYINIFDPDFLRLKNLIESKKINIEGFIKKINEENNEVFTLKQNFFGIINYNKAMYKKIEIPKFPFR